MVSSLAGKLDQTLAQYLGKCHDPVLLFSVDGVCEFANHGAHEVFGYGEDELVGQTLVKLFPFGYRTSDRQTVKEFREALQSKDAKVPSALMNERRYTLMGRTKREVDFPSRVGIFALEIEGTHKLVAIIRATYDDKAETEALLSPQREKIEQELQSGSFRVKSEFLGMAIHDLRTPIHKISLAADVLQTEEFSEERKREFLQMIGRAASAMGDLVNDLLDLTKIESGKITLSREPTRVDLYLEELCLSMGILAERKSIEISCEVDEDIPPVQLDQKRISQVVNNFLSNAMKFSEENTHIQVRAYQKDAELVIEVQDEGPGIPEEEQSKLFEAFSRSSNRPTKGEHSTGLGLAISKRIVELHGGLVGVRSQPGEGSTFYFHLPLS